MGLAARRDRKTYAAERSKQLMNCGSKSAIQLRNLHGAGQALGESARRDGEFHSSNAGKTPVNGSAKINLWHGFRRFMERSVKEQAGFGFHGAAVAGGPHLQLALNGFVEFADNDGCHGSMLAQER
jgi:hypothetical protein